MIASDGAALQLLQEEFPTLPAFPLPAYGVRYPFGNMTVNMLLQMPKIRRAIHLEQKALQAIVETHKVDVVISDSRFGCYSPQTYNVLLTHQLNIKAPLSFAEKAIAYWNKKMLNRFDRCWIPDFAEAPGLSGDLSHPSPVEHVDYVGPLSRMVPVVDPTLKRDLAVVLSGPEPQRSHLEKLVLQQIAQLPLKTTLVKGVVGHKPDMEVRGSLSILNYLTSEVLAKVLTNCDLVVARSGYTTIMDLVALRKQAVLVPTPGQTEQLYLADLMHRQRRFYCQQQETFELKKALLEAPNHIKIGQNATATERLGLFVDSLLDR